MILLFGLGFERILVGFQVGSLLVAVVCLGVVVDTQVGVGGLVVRHTW